MLLTVLESAHLSTAGLARDSLTYVLTIVLNSITHLELSPTHCTH